MLCIEFPSASPADVRGPQAVNLCGAARALLGDCSPLKTPTLKHMHIHTHTHLGFLLGPGCQLHANYYLFFLLFFSFQVKDITYKKLFTCLLSLVLRQDFWGLSGKTGVQLTSSQLVSQIFQNWTLNFCDRHPDSASFMLVGLMNFCLRSALCSGKWGQIKNRLSISRLYRL